MKALLVVLICLVTMGWALPSHAQTLSERDLQKLKLWARSYGVAAFPDNPIIGQLVVITDDSASNQCDSNAGSFISLCAWDGNDWISVGGGTGVTTLDQAFDGGKTIDGANSVANAVRIGDGTTPICIYTDATLGPAIRPCTDANARTYIWANFTWCLYDVENTSCTLTVDPDATGNDRYAWASGYGPLKTISFPADALYVQGSATLVTDTALISGGLISPYITITDSNSDGFHRYHRMPNDWDGGTITATITVVNVNATPANNFEVDISGECYPAGTSVGTTISTTGEQAANVEFDASGACGGSACSQNDPASATTAAITLNGTPAGGNFCGFQAQVDATATTETVAGIKVVDFSIRYRANKGF